ncbi:MAG TPA: hypothetical protein VFB78_01370 [Acidimicrobiales bacterium]|nr:hypothetical protein [Acidimicrobiales bacterium]
MSIQARLESALERAWSALEASGTVELDAPADVVEAATHLISLDSAPDRGMALAIAAGTAEDPASDPGALQDTAGVDRRGQAKALMVALTAFRDGHGLTLKISREPGVSNPWREPEIDDAWLARRARLPSAADFVTLVRWLRDAATEAERRERASSLLDHLAFLIAGLAQGGSFAYPRFSASPRLAMALVRDFLSTTPNRPDALEAVVCAATRAIADALPGEISVERRDTNSPDPIDVLVSGDHVASGIEVTDDEISLAKLQHEVVPAMLLHGLSHAVVVARPPSDDEVDAIDAYLVTIYRQFQQRIDLLTIDDIEKWFALPGLPIEVPSAFVWEIGRELDRHSAAETRRAWLSVLEGYVNSAI